MNDIRIFLTNLFAFDQSHPLLFTQFNFWAFLILVMVPFCVIVSRSKRLTLRNAYLFLVSLFFYYKTSGLFVLLLILSTVLGYFVGIRMDRLAQREGTQWRRKTIMLSAVIINLLVLAYFKYAYFFTDIYNNIFNTNVEVINHLGRFANHFTATARFNAETILLPVGISFFTFQNISYIIDVYKGKVAHAGNILDFGFYTTFFPQLVAGPIIRADQFIPQLYKPYFLGRRQFGMAMFWICNGLMKKIILSDYLATSFVDRVFDNPTLYTAFENLSALLVYSLQVYADFSGYTDIAIGVAMLMGFYLPKNFNSPYKSTNPAGFWKRWHISLSNWLKDYLYIPLGGNRHGSFGTYFILGFTLLAVALLAKTTWVTIVVCALVSLLLADYLLFPNHRKEFSTNINNLDTMLVGGLWHGASFNFITWGALNGIGIFVYKYWKKWGSRPRYIIMATALIAMLVLHRLFPSPAMNLFTVWTAIFCIGTALVMLVSRLPFVRQNRKSDTGQGNPIKMVWNILMTFLFISFTRLFFRSGSNLNPAEANEVAWRTAREMVNQIGGHWNLAQIPSIIANYWGVFLMFTLGMGIHWLPERFKRRYRLWFAQMPLWLMALVVAAVVFIVYQFVTADLQPFIYFQF
ncbi:MAG: MBOAT family protein [Bacteroidales bacterium]|nr:MBOAT family protein [Bacteroidales bacterium]